MGLAWQQGPLSTGAIGTFLTPEPLPERLLYAEPLRRRMSASFGGQQVAQSDDVLLLHEPGRYPVAYFPKADVVDGLLQLTDRVTEHPELGTTTWYGLKYGDREARRGAWKHTDPPAFAAMFRDRVAFAWHAMDAFREEAERVIGHASDPYHRIDIRQSDRHLVVRYTEAVVADTHRPLVLYESGFAPRWYVPCEDINDSMLVIQQAQTFCPYKGLATYWDIGEAKRAAWGYAQPYEEVERVNEHLSFEADRVEILLDGERQHAEPGQGVVTHGPDRGLTTDEVTGVGGRDGVRAAGGEDTQGG
jgi:uncharacterized protein (DUF427 family)